MKFPEIKKTISSFLLSEEGKITKQNILKIGVFLSAVSGSLALSSINVKAPHGNLQSGCCSCDSHTSGSFDHGSCDVSNVNIPAAHAHHIGVQYKAEESLGYGAHEHYINAHCSGSAHGSAGDDLLKDVSIKNVPANIVIPGSGQI